MKRNLLNVMFFKSIMSVRDGDCDSSPWTTKKLRHCCQPHSGPIVSSRIIPI